MKRVWPIIAVVDVPASAKWYVTLLGARQTHPGGTTFHQIVDEDGTVLFCLHHWGPTGVSGTHQWPTLLTPGSSDENGLLLWFVVDDFARAWERANGLGATIEEEPNTDRQDVAATALCGIREGSVKLRDTVAPRLMGSDAW